MPVHRCIDADLDDLVDTLEDEGCHITSITAVGDGSSYVVVTARRTGQTPEYREFGR